MHYKHKLKYLSFEERFFPYVQYSDDCWDWQGSSTNGYGDIMIRGRKMKAHRASYEYFYNEKLGNLLCCHHCDNPKCVNPFHSFAGTHKDNSKDCSEKGRNYWQQQTHCKNGHEFTEENTYKKKGRYRECRECSRQSSRKIKSSDPVKWKNYSDRYNKEYRSKNIAIIKMYKQFLHLYDVDEKHKKSN